MNVANSTKQMPKAKRAQRAVRAVRIFVNEFMRQGYIDIQPTVKATLTLWGDLRLDTSARRRLKISRAASGCDSEGQPSAGRP